MTKKQKEQYKKDLGELNTAHKNRFLIWNGWTLNYRPIEDGYITHASDEVHCRIKQRFIGLCGVALADSGMLNLGENENGMGRWAPGCKKCRNILIKRGFAV